MLKEQIHQVQPGNIFIPSPLIQSCSVEFVLIFIQMKYQADTIACPLTLSCKNKQEWSFFAIGFYLFHYNNENYEVYLKHLPAFSWRPWGKGLHSLFLSLMFCFCSLLVKQERKRKDGQKRSYLAGSAFTFFYYLWFGGTFTSIFLRMHLWIFRGIYYNCGDHTNSSLLYLFIYLQLPLVSDDTVNTDSLYWVPIGPPM